MQFHSGDDIAVNTNKNCALFTNKNCTLSRGLSPSLGYASWWRSVRPRVGGEGAGGTAGAPRLADSIIYATAKQFEATVWTMEDDFVGLASVRYNPKGK